MSAPRVITEPLGGGALSRAVQEGTVPTDWVVARPRGVDGWRARIDEVRAGAEVGRLLTVLAPAFEARGEARERLARVVAGHGVVVTTGQQPGLFGGPAYTLLKALSALALADRLERETGVPTLPVFWAATDDADFAEASWTAIADETGFHRLSVPRVGPEGTVMAEMPLGDVQDVLARMATAAASAPHHGVLESLRRAYRTGQSVGGAYVEFLRDLLEPLGIAVLDAWHPAVRAAARPTLLEALRRAASIDEALSLRTVAIERAGFRAQVARVPRLSLVFECEAGIKSRVPLARAIEAAGREAATYAPNVLLRPIVERAILPTVAYLAGPGELAYFAQVGAVADALGAAPPLAVPRWSATVVEPSTDRRLGRLGLTAQDLRDPHDPERRLGDRAMPHEVRDGLEALRREVGERVEALRAATAAAGGLVPERVVEGTRLQLSHRIDRLERRLRAAARAREADAVLDLAAVRAALMPEGHRQERRLNLVPLLARHGDLLLQQLKAGAALHAGSLVAS